MILLDTTPLVALCDPRDSLNRISRKHLKALARSEFALCEPVLTETCFHLPALSQRKRLQELLKALPVVPISLEGHDSWSEVFDWLSTYAGHDPDWTDGYLAVLCSREAKLQLWTYDAEFRTTWRKPDGAAIPLAIARK